MPPKPPNKSHKPSLKFPVGTKQKAPKGAGAVRRSTRLPKPTQRKTEMATDKIFEAAGVDMDKAREEDALDAARRKNDDGLDWLPHDPSRPSPPKNLWLQVYAPLKHLDDENAGEGVPEGAEFSIQCDEDCGKFIYLNGSYQELNAVSTPHNELRKPPICHIVSWAVLNVVRKEVEEKEQRLHTDAFLKHYCWQLANMRTGHNGCNSSGTKSTSTSYSDQEKTLAKARYKSAVSSYTGPVFQ